MLTGTAALFTAHLVNDNNCLKSKRCGKKYVITGLLPSVSLPCLYISIILLALFFFFVVVFCGSARDGEMYWDAKLYPDLKCMHFLHYFPLKIGETNDVEKVRGGRGWSEGDHFFQSGVHERRRRLILDILKAPEAYRSFLISSLKTTFTVCPFATGVLMQFSHKERNGPSAVSGFYPVQSKTKWFGC